MKNAFAVAALLTAALLVAGCNQKTTVGGQTGKTIDIAEASQIGCALAQVVGSTAGTVAADADATAGAQSKIATGRKILDDACSALNKLAPVIAATGATVSATVTSSSN